MSAILLGLYIGLVVAVTFAFFIITVQSQYFVCGVQEVGPRQGEGNCDLKANAFLLTELRFSSWVRSLTPIFTEASKTIVM